jgi:hypothetical protein
VSTAPSGKDRTLAQAQYGEHSRNFGAQTGESPAIPAYYWHISERPFRRGRAIPMGRGRSTPRGDRPYRDKWPVPIPGRAVRPGESGILAASCPPSASLRLGPGLNQSTGSGPVAKGFVSSAWPTSGAHPPREPQALSYVLSPCRTTPPHPRSPPTVTPRRGVQREGRQRRSPDAHAPSRSTAAAG